MGEDMKVIARGIIDPVKVKRAKVVDEGIKLLKGLVQVAQKPVPWRDAAGFGVVAEEGDALFEDFSGLG